MGALARPGPQLGLRGPQTPSTESRPFWQWFGTFLRDELSPYPGRMALVLRMTLAATLTMLAIMTFRLPGAAVAAYYTLILSRDTPVTTVRTAWQVMVAYLLGSGYALVCLLLLIDYPVTHFLWVTFSMFLCFYVIKVTTNYSAGAAFAFVITIVIPIWDTNLPTAALVVATLWTAGSVSVGLLCTVAVEYLFALFRETRNELHSGLATRAQAVADYLEAFAGTGARAENLGGKVQQLATVGVSRLRRLATHPASGAGGAERRSTTVSLLGRIVDLTATLEQLSPALSADERERLRDVADALRRLDPYFGSSLPRSVVPKGLPEGGHAIVRELEQTERLLEVALSPGPMDQPVRAKKSEAQGGSSLLPDAFSNPDHLMYSLRGCLAAMLCYVIYNGVAWRGLSTSMATCAITALTSVGASRQKQLLRISGAIVGGLFFGIGSQVLILPMLDSIAGFTVLFVAVTFISAWIGTSSPRLSYFGQQIALAYFLINLQEPFPQTNLAIARDRVMGVALGLAMMWLVFDSLGSRPAARVMRDLFTTNLRLLAQLAQPWRDGVPVDLKSLRSIRDKLSTNFGSVNAQADAVLFELGPSRARDLRLREQLLAWQPRLRSVFLIEVALLQYRAQVDLKTVAPEIVQAQVAFDNSVIDLLRGMADMFAGKKSTPSSPDLRSVYRELEAAVQRVYGDHVSVRAQGILALSSSLADSLQSLSGEFRERPVGGDVPKISSRIQVRA